MTAAVALKAAKKLLKKSQGSLGLQDVVEKVQKRLEKDGQHATTDVLEQWVVQSSKFRIQDDLVSLAKKKDRKRARPSSSESDSDVKKEASPSKKVRRDEPSSTRTSAEAWRREHNVVVMPAADDKKLQKKLAEKPAFFPFQSFDSDKIAAPLLEACKARFERPTPIQAQCWPILTAQCDVVGIAETGSGM